MPELAHKCISSWKKYLPDYEIKEWNEDNFDVNMIPYTTEAYKAKKYAFVSDYARFWILYKYGGLYFDTDVEVIKPMDDIITAGSFMGFENSDKTVTGVAPGLGLGAMQGLSIYKEIMDYYAGESFVNPDGTINLTTIVRRVTSLLCNHGLVLENRLQSVAGVNIYPYDFFCPIRVTDGKLCLTSNTVSIHHYASSWQSPWYKFARKAILLIGGYKLKALLAKLFK